MAQRAQRGLPSVNPLNDVQAIKLLQAMEARAGLATLDGFLVVS